ncbi:MAG: CD1375 family protein [Anaerotignum propionicum]|nr:CD1375 family protein [Anaerotignum propionicum]MEA5057786.1 CD1375 family protein [Anaerotignum propionicum]
MAKVYADLIKKGLKTIDEVPESLRDAVRAILEAESGNENA